MPMDRCRQNFRYSQQGVALITVLILLLIVTILGLTTSTTSTIDEKMAGNVQESLIAYQVAESGIESALENPALLSQTNTACDDDQYEFTFRGGLDTVWVCAWEVQSDPARVPGYGFNYTATQYSVRSRVMIANGNRSEAGAEIGFYKIGPQAGGG